MNDSQPYEAVWIPGLEHDIDRDESLAIGLRWLAETERAYGSPGVVVMYAKNMVGNAPLLGQAAARWEVVSPRSRSPFRSGPALVIWPPDDRTLELAEAIAHRYALCAIPGSRYDMTAWIRRSGAHSLVAGYDVEEGPALPADIAESLDHMLFFGGHNSFLGGGEKENAIRALHRISRHPDRPTQEEIEDYLRASGETSWDGVLRAGRWYAEILEGKRHRDYAGRTIR